MLPRLWLLVGSDRPTDRQCHLLSCPGQLKSEVLEGTRGTRARRPPGITYGQWLQSATIFIIIITIVNVRKRNYNDSWFLDCQWIVKWRRFYQIHFWAWNESITLLLFAFLVWMSWSDVSTIEKDPCCRSEKEAYLFPSSDVSRSSGKIQTVHSFTYCTIRWVHHNFWWTTSPKYVLLTLYQQARVKDI